MPNAVAAAWVISFEKILRTDPFAAEILSLMSLLDRQAIPDDFVLTYQNQRRGARSFDDRQHEDRKMRTESVGTLMDYSFITKSTENTYDMHRLVHLVTRRWLVKKSQFNEFASRATSVMYAAYPQPVWENWNALVAMMPHARAVVSHQIGPKRTIMERAEVLYRMGVYLRQTSQLADAERCTADSYLIWRSHLGASHSATLKALQLQLWIYADQGRLLEATKLGEGALLGRRLDGNNDVILAIARVLAEIYRRQGNLDKAQTILLSCLKTTTDSLGDTHDQTLDCVYNLALVYIRLGRLNEAQANLDRVIAAREKLKGKNHPVTLDAMYNLARIHSSRGDFQDSANLNKRIWLWRREQIGDDNTSTLASQHNYACDLHDLGQPYEAIQLMRDCQLREIRILGSRHPNTLFSKRTLSQWESQVGSEAREVLSPCNEAAQVAESRHPTPPRVRWYASI